MKLSHFLVLTLAVSACIFAARAEDGADAAAAAAAAPSSANAVLSDVFTPEQRAEIDASQQKYEFQTEVNRLMDIIINSLYTNRDIFIREVISNAADALDKIRFIGLTDKAALGEGALAELDIRIQFDKDARTLTITDKGVGMSKDELIKNLGVVARSGTSEFVEAAASGKSDTLSLIGQFGVGFYSVYLVADRVTVTSKANHDDQYIWESTANSTFTVARDPRGNTLGRGTSVTLHLKEDATEFLNERKLTDLVTKYSQFINFPILLQTTKTVTEEVEEPAPVEESDATKKEGDVEVSEEEDAAKPKTVKKKVTKEVTEDKRINAVKAIWTRSASDIEESEYNEFYKSLSRDHVDPLNKIHFSAEGDISFKSILFVPSKAEPGLYDKYYDKNTAIKLYVRRVLITDEFKDFLPRYLNFIKGVVDSDDLPLNVNRETLAQNRVLKVMSKKLVRKVLETLRKMAADEKKALEEEEEAKNKSEEEALDEADKEKEGKEEKKTPKLYTPFWNEFGKSIKLGVLDDQSNKNQLVKLIRFHTTKSDGKLVSFEEYVDRMGDKQKTIYYITGESEEAVKKSPFLEQAKRKGIEVILFTDPLDEYLVQSVPEFDGTPLQSLSKEGVKLGDEKKNLLKKQQEEFSPLTSWLKELYGSKVEKVTVSQRLATSPMVLATGQYGWSANMERIMKAQAFGDGKQASYMASKKTVEINPYHPIVKELRDKVAAEPESQENKDLAKLLYDAALLQSGFSMEEADDFASRVQRIVLSSLNLPADAQVDAEPEDDLPEDPEAPAEEATETSASSSSSNEDGQTIKASITNADGTSTPIQATATLSPASEHDEL